MPKQAKEKQNIPIAEIFSRLVIQDSPDAIVKLAETDMYTPAEFQLEPPYFAHPKSVPYLLSSTAPSLLLFFGFLPPFSNVREFQRG